MKKITVVLLTVLIAVLLVVWWKRLCTRPTTTELCAIAGTNPYATI